MVVTVGGHGGHPAGRFGDRRGPGPGGCGGGGPGGRGHGPPTAAVGVAGAAPVVVQRGLDGNPNHGGGSRRWITRAVEGSLRRLRTDRIDVYELGAPDPQTDIDETLDALTDLVAAGKIRSFGTSKMPPSQIAEARGVAERRGHGMFRTEEAPYSILNRAVEYDLLPTCRRLGIGVLAFGPLAGGWLSGRYRTGADAPGTHQQTPGGRMDPTAAGNAGKLAAADALGALADDAGLTLPQLATAFAARHPAVSTVLIGPRTLDQLEGSLTADGIDLSDDVLDRIDEIVPPASTVTIADTMWAYGTRALDPAQRRR